jgi:hypothetical protein
VRVMNFETGMPKAFGSLSPGLQGTSKQKLTSSWPNRRGGLLVVLGVSYCARSRLDRSRN